MESYTGVVILALVFYLFIPILLIVKSFNKGKLDALAGKNFFRQVAGSAGKSLSKASQDQTLNKKEADPK